MAIQPWRFSLHLHTMQIWTWFEYSRDRNKEPLLDGHDAARDLRFWFRDDYFEMSSLRTLYQELSTAVYDVLRGGPTLSREELLDIAAAALESGELVAQYEPELVCSYSLYPKKEPEIAAPQPSSIPEWFDIRVVWHDSGESARGLPIVVQPPNSSYLMRETDAEGRIHIDPVWGGPCEARCSFDGLHMDHCVQFVGTGDVTRSEEEKSPAPDRSTLRPRAIVTAIKHQVQTNETLEQIASGVNLTWQQLTKFNFGTEDPVEVNEHLRDDVGCTHKTADGQSFMFHDEDKPGILILPKKWSRQLDSLRRHVVRVMPVVRPTYELRVRLNVNPNDARTIDDTFTLIGGHEVRSPLYSQTKTTRDDLLPGDEFCDIAFSGLAPGLSYWLEVDQGQDGGRYFAIEAVSWSELNVAVTRTA